MGAPEAMTPEAMTLEAMTVEVRHLFPAGPERVWDLLTSVERMAGLGPEHLEAHWATPGPALGAQFTGRNRRDGREWTLSCTVDVYEPPDRFGWLVGEPSEPSSWWRYELLPGTSGGTLVAQRFRLGPGFSFLRRAVEKYPDREAEFVAGRIDELTSGMRATFSAAVTLL